VSGEQKAALLLADMLGTLRASHSLLDRKTDLCFRVEQMALQLERGVRTQAIDAFYSREQEHEEDPSSSTPQEQQAKVERLSADKAALEEQTESLRLRLRVCEERLQGASVDSDLRSQLERRGAEESLGRNAILKQHVNELSLELTRQQAQALEERTLLTQQLRTMLDGLSQENADLRHTLAHHGIETLLSAPTSTEDSPEDKEGKGQPEASGGRLLPPPTSGASTASASMETEADVLEPTTEGGEGEDEEAEGCVIC
jgi:hypothetical protein